MKLDVYRPRNASTSAKLPVVIFWHGGSWTGGNKERYAFMGAALADMGCVAVIVDYRKYPRVRYPVFAEDGALAVDWVYKEIGAYGGDPDCLFLIGHSAGTHTAAMLAYRHEYLREVKLPASSLRGFIGLSGPYDFFPRPDLRPIFPIDDPTRPWCLREVEATKLPALLLHGRLDYIVSFRISQRFAKALRKAGAPVQLRLFPLMEHFSLVVAYAWPFRLVLGPWRTTRAFIASLTEAS